MSKIIRVIVSSLMLAATWVRAADQVVPLASTLNQQTVGDLNCQMEGNQLRALDISPIRSQLKNLLAPENFQKLATNKTTYVTVDTLEAAGVKTKFDFQNLQVTLNVPPEMRQVQNINLLGSSNVRAVNTYEPADFSAYMNLLGGVNYVETGANAKTGFSDPQVAVQNVFNYHRLVLNNEIDLNPSPDQRWQKRDTSLIYDFPEQRVRATVGDLNYPVTGFQNFLPLLGFSLNRQDSLQPYRVTSPLGQSAFFLQSDSKVDVIVNGHVTQSLQLSAGPHQISNFPLTGGANNVVLRITDPVGRVQYINARLFYDPGLLKAGESAFNYAVGFPSRTDSQNPYYEYDSKPAVSAYHRLGLTDRITAGLSGQATSDTQMGGPEIVFSTTVGTFDFNSVVSHDRTIGGGSAHQVQYHYYLPHESWLSDGQFTLSSQYQSSDYTAPTPFVTPADHGTLWTSQVQYSQSLGERWFAGISYSNSRRGNATQLANWSLISGYHWGRIYADVTLNNNSGDASHDTWTAFFSLRINLDFGQNLFSSYDTGSRTSRSEWQYVPSENIQSASATVGVQDTSGQNDFYGNVNYTGHRADLAFYQTAMSGGNNQSTFNWGTALVYADGQFGVSRPIQDSFAIIKSTGSLMEDGGVGVQPQSQRYLAQEDWLGPAVLPQVTGYYPTHITAEPLRAEADFDPQEGDILLKPTYRSGTLIHLGHPATLDATAKLVWANGQPAVYQTGKLVAENGTSIEFVSNGNGLAYFSGLSAGKYHGTISGYPDSSFAISVQSKNARLIDLGEITLPVKP